MSLKVADYLISQRPFLSIFPESSAISDILKRMNSEYMIPANRDWEKELARLMEEIVHSHELLKRNEKTYG